MPHFSSAISFYSAKPHPQGKADFCCSKRILVNNLCNCSHKKFIIQDVRDYLKPILRRNPDSIILHMGTNDVNHKKVKKIMNNINSLLQEIKDTNPEIEVILSGLTTREENPQTSQTVIEVNTMLENYCEDSNMHLITHEGCSTVTDITFTEHVSTLIYGSSKRNN